MLQATPSTSHTMPPKHTLKWQGSHRYQVYARHANGDIAYAGILEQGAPLTPSDLYGDFLRWRKWRQQYNAEHADMPAYRAVARVYARVLGTPTHAATIDLDAHEILV